MEVRILSRPKALFRSLSMLTDPSNRKHVLGDLRPYICLHPDCYVTGQDFQRRHQWMQHVQQAHWKTWLCPLGCKNTHIEDIPALESHLATFHKEHAETLSPESLVRLAEHDRPLDAPKNCELCNEELDSFKSYSRHVGRHQEDVALFVLPDRGLDEESLSVAQNEESSKGPGLGYLQENEEGGPESEGESNNSFTAERQWESEKSDAGHEEALTKESDISWRLYHYQAPGSSISQNTLKAHEDYHSGSMGRVLRLDGGAQG